MLRLTKLTDYAILLMSHMASLEGGLQASGELASATRIPSPTVSKVLQALLGAGLLESIRGARGGYRLARPASQISVREIISCFEGHIALTECNLDDVECDQMAVCSTQGNWKRINQAIHDALQDISLQEMTQADFMPQFRLERPAASRKVVPIAEVKL